MVVSCFIEAYGLGLRTSRRVPKGAPRAAGRHFSHSRCLSYYDAQLAPEDAARGEDDREFRSVLPGHYSKRELAAVSLRLVYFRPGEAADLCAGSALPASGVIQFPFNLRQDATQYTHIVIGEPKVEQQAAQLEDLGIAALGLEISHLIQHADQPRQGMFE